jgi:hypothetical protein
MEGPTVEQLALAFEEELYPCPSYPGWFVTKDGRIWSSRTRGRWIHPYRHNLGYLYTKYHEGHRLKSVGVHRVIADAFLGPCPDGYEVNHKDRDKTNNSRENLEYVTRRQNMHHYARSMGWQISADWLDGWQLPRDLWVERPGSRLASVIHLYRQYPMPIPVHLVSVR